MSEQYKIIDNGPIFENRDQEKEKAELYFLFNILCPILIFYKHALFL